eukprot:CAMPEP_0185774184 /NCGR_PEP_ID=MMETSP1174-20130828/77058_1 /TAXON_ID=35687 /ORGANISM="Dictyocha speculum, Strain CCMP1381" /LENGTH=136 /DNA_ID=CAMNT_0028461221 /DNA_START=40 /DNA_END=450 /DNA_ORIENTATION=+
MTRIPPLAIVFYFSTLLVSTAAIISIRPGLTIKQRVLQPRYEGMKIGKIAMKIGRWFTGTATDAESDESFETLTDDLTVTISHEDYIMMSGDDSYYDESILENRSDAVDEGLLYAAAEYNHYSKYAPSYGGQDSSL